MSFWSKLFGSKPLTVDDQIIQAGKAAGYPLPAIKDAMERNAKFGYTKETLLEYYQDQLKKKSKG